MECDICGRENAVNCVTCARGHLEEARIAKVIIEISQDEVGKHVQAVVEGSEDKDSQHVSLQDSKGGLLVDRQECTNNIDVQRMRAETAETEERTALINEQAALLRQEIEVAREELRKKRELLETRKNDFESQTHNVEARRANERDQVQQTIKRLGYEFDKTHASTMDMRAYLCNSAANIAYLKRAERVSKDGDTVYTYHIGPPRRPDKNRVGLKIWDLRDLNDAPHDELSAALLSVTQLLIRVTAYLGVRLPSEITLPHKDCLYPTIIRPDESWEGKKPRFPGSTPSHSSSNSPEESRTSDEAQFPRARVLFLDRPLPNLRVEDKAGYLNFIEAVAYLGYNIAWLCRIEGMKEDVSKWEHACQMGKNLHGLLVEQATRQSQRPENPLDKDIPESKSGSHATKKKPVALGELSYSTSHSFALDVENVQRLGGWRLTPWKMYNELRQYLYTEEQTRDWEEWDSKEWEDMENAIEDDPVMVGKRRSGESDPPPGEPNKKVGEAAEGGEERKRGVNGWTRVKSRSEEPAKKSPTAE